MSHGLHELGEEVRRIQDEALMDERRRTAVRRRLLDQPDPPSRTKAFLHWRPVLGAVAIGAASLVLFLTWPRTEAPVAYRVDEGSESREVDRVIGAPEDRDLPIQFTDGASVRLTPGTRARIARLSPRGATLRLESGQALVSVRHRESTRWSVQAGPFLVRVTGTRFRVDWDPHKKLFGVEVFEGEVRVSGPDAPDRIVRGGADVRVALEPEPPPEAPSPAPRPPSERSGGQDRRAADTIAPETPPARDPAPRSRTPRAPTTRESALHEPTPRAPAPALELDLPPKQPDAEPDASGASPPTQTPEPEPEPEPQTTKAPERQTDPPEQVRKPAWIELFERNQHARALTELEPQEIEQALWQADANDLIELGAAARRINDRRAGYVYSVVRSRFPGSENAADAAFMLARMHFHSAAPQMAATWFETYLRERPRGRFAREAAGRLIEAYQQAADQDRARAAAERYLERYPKGPHAELASSVLE